MLKLSEAQVIEPLLFISWLSIRRYKIQINNGTTLVFRPLLESFEPDTICFPKTR